MRRAAAALLAVAFGVAAGPGLAAENEDLDRIPQAVPDAGSQPAAPPAAPASGRLFVEDAFSLMSNRGGLVVPFPPPAPARWQNRTSLDASYQWTLTDRLSLTFSDRFNLEEENDFNFPSFRTTRNDFREGYVTFEPLTRVYLEAGRINVRNGVAAGFNPTDFFRTRTALDLASVDPSALREDRLGTVMARAQTIWDGGSFAVAYAPRLYDPTPINATVPAGVDPRFDLTSDTGRLLLSLNADVAGLAPQALLFQQNGQTRLGLNVSHPIGNSIIAYGEWAGGRQPSLIATALAYGKQTGTIPDAAPNPGFGSGDVRFRNDLAVGASWTSEAKVTINLEYHYHEAGFSQRDWRNWFDLGGPMRTSPGVASELWYIRGYANAMQDPMTQHEAFLRADWTDAFVKDLELTALAFVNLYDGSSLTQVSASYFLTDTWTIGCYVSGNLGAARSERGSMPQLGSAIVQLTHDF
jgi:hypothetical protein